MEKPLNTERLETLVDGSVEVIEDSFRGFRQMLLAKAGNVAKLDDKADGSPVTAIDIEVEEKLKAIFKDKKIDIPVFGEETGYDDNNLPELCWLIDPVDGTSSFIKNVPAFTNMAVLINKGESIASVIYNPTTDAMFVAKKGRGAFKNGQKIILGDLQLPNKALCKPEFITTLNAILKPAGIGCYDGPSGGGFGFTTVLNGEAAARFNIKSRGYTHDYAPGALLVKEAGGDIIPVKEDAYNFKTQSFVACHPALSNIIRENLSEIRKLEA
jgi:fructose-1,6-bisphosphatase/inositol monophosphatase family enzyme